MPKSLKPDMQKAAAPRPASPFYINSLHARLHEAGFIEEDITDMKRKMDKALPDWLLRLEARDKDANYNFAGVITNLALQTREGKEETRKTILRDPLTFFSWTGLVKDRKPSPAPAPK